MSVTDPNEPQIGEPVTPGTPIQPDVDPNADPLFDPDENNEDDDQDENA